MIFSDRDIKRLVSEGIVKVHPEPDFGLQLGSCSLDLRLGSEFRVFDEDYLGSTIIDVRDPEQIYKITKQVSIGENEPFVLHSNSFVLGITLEKVELPDDIVARLEGRSSLGRLGIIVHATASIIDPGWRGRIVLELANHGAMPVALYSGMRICAVTFESISTPVDSPYWLKSQAKYLNQENPTPSRISADSEVDPQIRKQME